MTTIRGIKLSKRQRKQLASDLRKHRANQRAEKRAWARKVKIWENRAAKKGKKYNARQKGVGNRSRKRRK